jgi:EAL domain-containing protein (putative c-di-GMP-specific phosphodiesterase class I)
VPPSTFVPVAERTGLIRELGDLVLRRACDGLAAWRASTGADTYVSVNVSPLQLDEHFPAAVDRLLSDTGLPPSALVLEVTEGMLLVESSRGVVRELRSLGVRVAIDDFGTGYSSLSYLRELPVDMVKVDQLFLRPGPGGTDDHTLLHAVIRLAESLRLTTICEGVETPEQLAELQATTCDYAQGYLLCRPAPLDDIPPFIDVVADRVDRALF